MPAKIVNKLKQHKDKNGTVYTITYKVHEDEILEYRRANRDSADEWTGDSGTYISEYDEPKRIGDHFLVSYKAYSNGYEGFGNFSSNKGSKIPRPLKKYSKGFVKMTPNFWGLRKAEITDVEAKILNIENSACSKGDWLHKNATKDIKGLADYTECPFLGVTKDNFKPEDFLNQDIDFVIYSIVYYSRWSISHFYRFTGVSGGFDRYSAPYLTLPAMWKSTRQDVEEVQIDDKIYVKTTRVMQAAPTLGAIRVQLTWKKPTYTWIW